MVIAKRTGNVILTSTPQIHPRETLRSYLTRTAMENCLGSPLRLLAGIRRRLTDTTARQQCRSAYSRAWFRVTSELTAVPEHTLFDAYKRTFGALSEHLRYPPTDEPGAEPPDLTLSTYTNHVRRQTGLAICPLCLADVNHEPANWAPLYSLCCTKHDCYLHTRCPNCSQPFDSNCLAAGICTTCGARLTKMGLSEDSPSQRSLQSQKLVDQLWGENPVHVTASLPNTDRATLFLLLHGITRLIMIQESQRKPKPTSHTLVAMLRNPTPDSRRRVAASLATAYDAIHDWPDGLYAFLQRLTREAGSPHKAKESRILTRLYQTFSNGLWRGERFDFLRSAFEDYIWQHQRSIHSRWVERLDCYRNKPSFRARFEAISISEAAFRLHIESPVVERLIDLGVLEDLPSNASEVDSAHWVSASAVDEMLEKPCQPVASAAVADYLGTSLETVFELVGLGLLSETDSEGDESAESIDQHSLRAFKLRLMALTHTSKIDWVSLGDAAIALQARGWSKASILQVALNGRIRARNIGELVGDIQVSANDVKLLRHRYHLHPYIGSAKQLAREFEVKVAEVFRWFEYGLLDTASKAMESPFSLSGLHIRQLKERFVSFNEAVRIVGIPSPTLHRHVASGRIRALGPVERNQSTGLLYRKDVDRLSRNNTMTSTELLESFPIDKLTLERLAANKTLFALCGPGIDSRESQLFIRAEVEEYFRLSKQAAADLHPLEAQSAEG